MQKTYWWRITVLMLGMIMFGWGYLAVNASELKLYNPYIDPLMFLSISLIAISPFLFFVHDMVFLKWLRFALVWFALAVVFIILSPEYQGGWIGIGPEKESVSIWMSSLFVIISLIKISWDSWKIRKSSR